MTVPTTRYPDTAPRGLNSRLARRLGLAGGAGWLLTATLVLAQTPATAPAPATPAKPAAAPNTFSPTWAELTAGQREVLAPLASTWPTLSQTHKRKWVEMARSYASHPPEEQAKIQGRMKEWVALSPAQRAQARLNFARTRELSKELTAEEKKAKWEAYQSLSDEEKRKLASTAPRKPAGAAPASKPVARQKLASVPSPLEPKKANPAPKIVVSQPTDSPAVAPSVTPPAVANGVAPQPH